MSRLKPRPTKTGPCGNNYSGGLQVEPAPIIAIRRKEQRSVLDLLGTLQRTRYCGNLRAADVDKDVVLMGWVHRRRDLGNLIFIDLRDRSGLAQIVSNKEQHAAAH